MNTHKICFGASKIIIMIIMITIKYIAPIRYNLIQFLPIRAFEIDWLPVTVVKIGLKFVIQPGQVKLKTQSQHD